MTDLPSILPIFPLPGALLLPGGRLPLNIFEPRYLAMTEDALAGQGLIGLIQPRRERGSSAGASRVHATGCAGQLGNVRRTRDGRLLVELAGRQRFCVTEELPPVRGYRRVSVEWLAEPLVPVRLDRTRLLPALRRYLEQHELACDWSRLDRCPDDRLVTTLAMICPFSPGEQQALLEAPTLAARAELLLALIELSSMPQVSSTLN